MSLVRFILSPFFSVLLLLFVISFEICKAKETHICRPSSCGLIRNISHPFRLKTDPGSCGDHNYELACEENQTVLDLYSRRYYVEEINYRNFSMRVVDPGIQKDNCSSLPLYFLTPSHFGRHDPYALERGSYGDLRPNTVLTFMSCPFPVHSSAFVDSTLCHRKSRRVSLSASSSTHSYVLCGKFRASDMEDSCTLGNKTLVSIYGPKIDSGTSFSRIHVAMAYGFELLWFHADTRCKECWKNHGHCCLTENNDVRCTNPLCLGLVCSSCFLLPLLDIVLDIGAAIIGKTMGAHLAMLITCGIPCMSVFLVYKFRRRHLSIYDDIEEFLQSQNNLMPIRYSYSQLRKITKGFKDKLGEGGCGIVHKGTLRGGYDVAVKVLGKSKANGQDFISEVATIGRTHHVNVVRLIGFCVERSKRALVYEFMANGSLAQHIFAKGGQVNVSWEKMFEISLGVARGIEYLHRGCDMQILHFDIKPHNILLNESLTPKISDFGLAKLCSTDDSIVSLTAARGTMGYMAPELFYKNMGGVSSKADVYSFGMLLMEMAARRRNLNVYAEHLSQIYFPSWVYDQLRKGEAIELGDTTGEERKMVKKMIIVALWCIQMRPSERPSIAQVIEMLERTTEDALQMPPKPFLSPQEIPNRPTSSYNSSGSLTLHIN